MLRLALIGCSSAARYIPLGARLRGGRFTAVVDEDPEIARDVARTLNANRWAPSFDSLLAEHGDEFDALIVHIPDRFRAPLCQQAAAAGKHLFVDWPLVLGPSRTGEVIAACQRAGVCLMVGQELRFLPSVQVVNSSLDWGKLGEPGLLRIHRWEPRPTGTEPARPLTREIDLACWFFGGWPNAVFADQRSGAGAEWPDYAWLHLGFPSGAMALIDHAQSLPPGDDYFSLSLIGSSGAAYADDHHNRQLLFKGGPPAAILTEEGAGLLAMLREFIAAVEEKRAPLVGGADYLRASEIAGAGDLSLARSCPLKGDANGYVLVE